MTKNANTATKMTLKQRVESFIQNNESLGATGLALLNETVIHAFDNKGSKDWTPLANLIAKLPKTDAAIMRKIVGSVTEHVTVSKTDAEKVAAGTPALTFKRKAELANGTKIDYWFNSTNMAMLADLVSQGKSFRSQEVRDAFFPKAEKAAFDIETAVKSAKTRTAKLFAETDAGGIEFRKIINAMEAEWTRLMAEKNQAESAPLVADVETENEPVATESKAA